jgi:hypothetical protein
MTLQDAQGIATWHYPPPYTFYDVAEDADDLAALLAWENWLSDSHFAVDAEDDLLAGYFTFEPKGNWLEV